MTTTDSAQDAAETTPEPLTADQVGAESLYVALTRLMRAAGPVVEDVEKNTANLHRHVDGLRAARDAAHDLLHPPPAPDAPEGAIVLYARALRPGDRFLYNDRWAIVTALTVPHNPLGDVIVRAPGYDYSIVYKPEDLVVVQRRTPQEAPRA